MTYVELVAGAPKGREWKAILRLDPCAYCGGEGGTVDHIAPRPETAGMTHLRGDWLNLTGACEPCNRRKDKGKDGGHRGILEAVAAATENKRRVLLIAPWLELPLGTLVKGPFFDAGEVVGFVEHRGRPMPGKPVKHSILVAVPDHPEPWRCANPFCLRVCA